MEKVAFIMTVYNRKEITLRCLKYLHQILEQSSWIDADIYMTDDGSQDGTKDAVAQQYPNVIIVQGTGNLFWAGGMNLAWKKANESKHYCYFVWLNDDAILFNNALNLLFEPIKCIGDNVIVSAAFKDDMGKAAYGGRDKKKRILVPNGTFQPIVFMNGNLTLIPANIANQIGYIDDYFIHIGGDWDYGLRARKQGVKILLTKDYVGITNRHDNDCINGNIIKRIRTLYSIKHDPFRILIFNKRHFGYCYALLDFIKQHIIFLFPQILIFKRHFIQK